MLHRWICLENVAGVDPGPNLTNGDGVPYLAVGRCSLCNEAVQESLSPELAAARERIDTLEALLRKAVMESGWECDCTGECWPAQARQLLKPDEVKK
jgi:hypothetical protein